MRHFTLLIILFFISFTCLAKVWRVNSNEDIDADFNNIQDAVEAAEPGDTLYIEAGRYSSSKINKKLTLIGTGFFLEENYPDELQYKNIESSIGYIIFEPGAEGSVLIGLTLLSNTYIYTSNIKILRNYIQHGISITDAIPGQVPDHQPLSNIIISGNYFSTFSGMSGPNITVRANMVNFRVSNNFFKTGIRVERGQFDGEHTYSLSGVFIKNNIFFREYSLNSSTNAPSAVIDINNATIENNIFLAGPIIGDNNLLNNLSSEDIGNDQGNISFVDMSTVFKEDPAEISYYDNYDGSWQLAEDSPAKGAGTNGEDAGMFGGTNPYVLSGLPPLPSVYEINSIPNTTVEKGLPVKVKIRVRN